MSLRPIAPFLRYWRTSTALDREVVDAVVEPTDRDADGLAEALAAWPGRYYWSSEGPHRLVLIRPLRPARRERWGLHVSLFLVTLATVWMAGAFLVADPVFIGPIREGWRATAAAGWDWVLASAPGLGFAAALMAILLAHELGHYFVARWYHIDASPPYFLPAPPFLNFIGTFGAFIRLRSPIVDRRQLLDVGAAGPWAGLVLAIVVLAAGLGASELVPGMPGETRQFIYLGREPFFLGDSLLMGLVRRTVVGEGTVLLHPLALAGWFGVLITMLNLLPLGQLDGGHILYALVGRHQAVVARLMWYGLVVIGFTTQFWGWWVWAALILILGRGRIAHPSVLDPHRPVPKSRWPLGIATGVLFVLTFTADPLPSIPPLF